MYMLLFHGRVLYHIKNDPNSQDLTISWMQRGIAKHDTSVNSKSPPERQENQQAIFC